MVLPHRPIQHPHLAKGDQTLNAIGFNSKQSHLVGFPYLQYSGLILAIGLNSKQRLINQFNKKKPAVAPRPARGIITGALPDSLTASDLFAHQVEYSSDDLGFGLN